MASRNQWAWVWMSSGRWWKTGKCGILQSTGLQKVGHNWATEQQQIELKCILFFFNKYIFKIGLEEEMTTHFTIPAWRTPWAEEPSGLHPWGCTDQDVTEHTCIPSKLMGRQNLRFYDFLELLYSTVLNKILHQKAL